MSWSVVADALQRPRDRSQQACRSRACRPRVRTPATGRRPTSYVRRATSDVRRAACVQCVSAARDRQPVTQPPRHVPVLPFGRRTRPASLPRGLRTSAVRFPDCLATRDEHLLAHFHQSLSIAVAIVNMASVVVATRARLPLNRPTWRSFELTKKASAMRPNSSAITSSSSSTTLTITKPDDWHLHLRDGESVLSSVVPHTASTFARAVRLAVCRP